MTEEVHAASPPVASTPVAEAPAARPPVAPSKDQIAMQKMAEDLGAFELELNKKGLSVVGLLRKLAKDQSGFRG